MLTDSENESDDEQIPDLGKNIWIEPDIVESSDDGEETVINSVVVTKQNEFWNQWNNLPADSCIAS